MKLIVVNFQHFRPTTNAIMALTVAKYLVQPIFSQGDELPDEAIRLLAAVFITFLTWLNCYSMKITTRLQNTFMVTKILALALLIVIGFVAMFQGKQTAENANKSILALPNHYAPETLKM